MQTSAIVEFVKSYNFSRIEKAMQRMNLQVSEIEDAEAQHQKDPESDVSQQHYH